MIAFGLVYFGVIIGLYAVNFWLPQMVKSLGSLTNLQVGLVIMVPCALAGAAMVLWGLHSDRTGERRWHVALPALVAAVVLAGAAALEGSATASLVAIGLGFVAICAAVPAFWTLPAAILTGTAAAGGIALINSIGNIGGFARPVSPRGDQGIDGQLRARAVDPARRSWWPPASSCSAWCAARERNAADLREGNMKKKTTFTILCSRSRSRCSQRMARWPRNRGDTTPTAVPRWRR